jgi:flagellar protein FliO/FliZ
MDLVTYGRFAIALAVVVGLLAGFAWLMRKYGQGRLMQGGNRGRIGIVEVTGLDTRRRLVLLRRDDVEHLVILGPTGETVVERGIVPPASTAPVRAPAPAIAP